MWLLIIFALYLVALAAIGLYCMRMNRTLADFVLGGRRLGVWVTAISAQASDMSAWLLIGLPAMAYAEGLSAIWIVIGCGVGTIFNWLVIAPRLRAESERLGALTIPDYLAARYGGDPLYLVRVISVVVILLAYATYIASQFMAAGKVFETTFARVETPWGPLSVGYHTGMLIGVGIILLYTTMGGFMAVSWTDLAQGLLMVVTVVVLPLVGLLGLGGLAVMGGKLNAADPSLLTIVGTKGAAGAGFWLGVCVGNLSWGLGYPGIPHILVRFMALRDPKAMHRAAIIGIIWVLLAMTGAVFVGLVGRAIVGGLADKDHVMPALAMRLMHPAVAGIMIAGAMAAMMSTVDSQLLVAASAVEQDIYIRLLGGRPRARTAVWIARITVLALGAAALPIAWFRSDVLKTVFNAWGLLGAALGPVVILGLLTKRTNHWGAVAGMVVGAGVANFWQYIWPVLARCAHLIGLEIGREELSDNGLMVGFLLNLVVAYVVSLATSRWAGGTDRHLHSRAR